ncbi:MAG: hypothetical protein EBZ61_03390 [Micrococcales bacterium]|nr:hypothetical protein [Micrococcales bacterium]
MKKLAITICALVGLTFTSVPVSAAPDPCDLANNDVSNCDYSGRDFFNGVLNDKNMSGANLSSLKSRFSYWERTNLTGANLDSANLYYADLIDANLTSANLTNALLTSATLTNTDFSGATLTGIVSGNVSGTPKNLPAGWKVTAGHIVGPTANLINANLEGADLTGVDLSGAILTGVRSGGITGNPVLPEDWQLLGGYLFGPGADLSYAKLDGIGIWYLNLTGANLTGASVNGTNFIYPKTFEGVTSGGMKGNLLAGAKIVKGYLIAPKVNLEGADLQGVDLSGMDLEGVNLRGANFTQAILANVNMPGCYAINTDFSGAILTGANMRGCVLRNASFNQAVLTDTMLGYSVLVGCEFYGSKFTRTEFLFSQLSETRSQEITGSFLGDGNFVVEDGVIYNRFLDDFDPVLEDVLATGDMAHFTFLKQLPELTTFKIQWLRNGVEQPYSPTGNYLVKPTDYGQQISVKVTVQRPGYVTEVIYPEPRTVVAGKLYPTAVRITGKAKVGAVLTARTSSWVAGSKKSYVWLRSGKAIKGATKSTYKATAADKGKKISVKVTQTSLGYSKASAVSSAITVR